MQEEDILEQFTKKEDISGIFDLVKSKKIVKTQHFYDRLIMRDLSEELVDKTLHKKIKSN